MSPSMLADFATMAPFVPHSPAVLKLGTSAATPYAGLRGYAGVNRVITVARSIDASIRDGMSTIFSPDQDSSLCTSGFWIASAGIPNPLMRNESSVTVADMKTRWDAFAY